MKRFPVVMVIAVTFLFSACSSDKTTNTEPECPGRTTPENLLKMLACAFEARDIDAYETLLHDDFIFVFIPDLADSLGLPPDSPWWGKVSDLVATGNLFEDSTVTEISFSYDYVIEWFPYVDVRADTTYSGLLCRIDPVIQVEVEEPGEENKKYRSDMSWLDVFAVPDPYAEGLWVMLRIEEHSKQGLAGPAMAVSATVAMSWSAIKVLWTRD